MKWKKQWVDNGEIIDTTEKDAEKHLLGFYKNVKQVLKDLPIGQKIRNPFAYYWKEE